LDENDLTDQAFLRRMGYRARVEPPTASAYSAIFRRQAASRGIECEQSVLDHILLKYKVERRMMKGCEPRDLLDRATDLCIFEGEAPKITNAIIDVAWRNYFGKSHGFAPQLTQETMIERTGHDSLEV
jgi:hypothetical protein